MLEPAVTSCDACALGKNGPCLFRPREVPASTTLVLQGSVATQVLFVKDGAVGLSATDASGDELSSSVRGPRAILSLEALAQRTSAFTITALTDTVVCGVDATELRRATGLDAQRTLTSSLLGLVLEEHAATLRDHDLQSGSARARVARFLVAYSRLMRPGRRAAFSKTHVASLLGMRAETLSRMLRQLEEEGLVLRDTLEILNLEGLAEIGRGAS